MTLDNLIEVTALNGCRNHHRARIRGTVTLWISVGWMGGECQQAQGSYSSPERHLKPDQ
ncbi:TPA: hypothetical protein ACH3X2_002606, partial [Trebouxia sp. C0005]